MRTLLDEDSQTLQSIVSGQSSRSYSSRYAPVVRQSRSIKLKVLKSIQDDTSILAQKKLPFHSRCLLPKFHHSTLGSLSPQLRAFKSLVLRLGRRYDCKNGKRRHRETCGWQRFLLQSAFRLRVHAYNKLELRENIQPKNGDKQVAVRS